MGNVRIKIWGLAAFFAVVFGLFQVSLAQAADVNGIIANTQVSVGLLPGLITASSYLLALLLGVLAIFKIKDHVENPAQTPLREGIIRFIAGGALLALPILYDVVESTINGGTTTVFDNTTSTVSDVKIGAIGAIIPALSVDDLLQTIIDTSRNLPGLISGLGYLLGLLLVIAGVLKIKDHVDNPTQTSMREGVIRLLVAGALFALPTVFDAMYTTFTGGASVIFDPDDSLAGTITGFVGGLLGLTGIGMNGVLINLIGSLEDVPGFITAVAYLLGLLMGVLGLLKIKDHVENPTQVPLKEGVVRLLVGGAFFAIPVIYQAMYDGLGGDVGVLGSFTSFIGMLGFQLSADDGLSAPCIGFGLPAGDLGTVLCNLLWFSTAWPGFLKAIAYLFGLVLGFWGLLKVRDHVINPAQTALSEGISRFIAGGAFFALPLIVETARTSITPITVSTLSTIIVNTGFNDGGGICAIGAGGLDNALNCFINSIFGPLTVVLNFFGYVVGIILIMIGISRLIKSSQEGARGPGGLGTMMTFLAGGAMISFNPLLRTFTSSFFAYDGFALGGMSRTFATLKYTTGMSPAEVAHAHIVLSAILKFMTLVGLISFIRGIFIVRNVAEGNQQASIMAGVTHLVGGALAVNLGPLLNAVQTTLGIAGFGVGFT